MSALRWNPSATVLCFTDIDDAEMWLEGLYKFLKKYLYFYKYHSHFYNFHTVMPHALLNKCMKEMLTV